MTRIGNWPRSDGDYEEDGLMLCFLARFKIQDDEIGKDDLAAWACIRLDRLRSGYRIVRLLDANSTASQGILLVKIEKSII